MTLVTAMYTIYHPTDTLCTELEGGEMCFEQHIQCIRVFNQRMVENTFFPVPVNRTQNFKYRRVTYVC